MYDQPRPDIKYRLLLTREVSDDLRTAVIVAQLDPAIEVGSTRPRYWYVNFAFMTSAMPYNTAQQLRDRLVKAGLKPGDIRVEYA